MPSKSGEELSPHHLDQVPPGIGQLSHSTLEEAEEILAENEQLREQIETQTQLMHLLTHQLATPLTSLKGSIHLLSEAVLDDEQEQEFLEVVRQQVRRLRTLLQDVVALRSLETGLLQAHAIAFCPQQLINEVIGAEQICGVNRHFSTDLPLVWGDRWQVSQVLVNLLSNAVKYSPVDSFIEVGAQIHQSDWVEIWVEDHGLGIPEADQAHLFERFYRVKHHDRQTIEGTGLGLSLCKLLVENQGGQIDFHSLHGRGSRFYFTLPIAKLPTTETPDGKL
ncbi:MAG: HAMP domain-containing histidine kinase [Scytolyngbya sp. HA4215-MV1]|nr:HAMP domain-containing histidine kinase [Scytolyngbya sp. HA4215-MV1]